MIMKATIKIEINPPMHDIGKRNELSKLLLGLSGVTWVEFQEDHKSVYVTESFANGIPDAHLQTTYGIIKHGLQTLVDGYATA
jgi:hypothetical protein